MRKVKNLTRTMIIELGKKCKIKPEEYGYIRNSPELIELVNKRTNDSRVIYKSDYTFHF